MRTSARPITDRFFKSLKMLTKKDVEEDSSWKFAPIVCASNYERHIFNEMQLRRFAQEHGEPILYWYCPLRVTYTAKGVNKLGRQHYENPPTRSKSFSRYCQFVKCFFVRGAPCYIVDSQLNPNKSKIVNGTPGILHSLTWEDGFTLSDEQMAPGAENEIPIPYSVNVLVDGKIIPNKAKERKAVIPKSLRSNKGGEPPKFAYWGHFIELGFGITFHKVQGQTLEKLIMVLNPRVGGLARIAFDSLYVAMSRVKTGRNLRVWPMPRECLNYLKKLRPHPHIHIWNLNYDNGMWIQGGLIKSG